MTTTQGRDLELGDVINGRRVTCLDTSGGLVKVWVDGRERLHRRADLLYRHDELVTVEGVQPHLRVVK